MRRLLVIAVLVIAAPPPVVQNLYYGPDQEGRSLDFLRFFSDTVVEWRSDRVLPAAGS